MKTLNCPHLEPLPGAGYRVAPVLLLPLRGVHTEPTAGATWSTTIALCGACVERGQQLAREDGKRRLNRDELSTGASELVRMLRERGAQQHTEATARPILYFRYDVDGVCVLCNPTGLADFEGEVVTVRPLLNTDAPDPVGVSICPPCIHALATTLVSKAAMTATLDGEVVEHLEMMLRRRRERSDA